MPSYRFTVNSMIFGLFILGNSTGVVAQESLESQSENQFRLTLASEVGSIDNFLYQSDNQENTSFIKLSPSLFLQTARERQLFNITMNSDHAKYQNFSQDDHSNLLLKSNYQYKFTNNKAWFVNASMRENYELRGTGLSLGSASELNKGDDKQILAFSTGYFYGNADSIARLKVEVGLSDASYKTRRALTRVLDTNSQFINTSFDYLLSGQSYVTADLAYKNLTAAFNPSQDKSTYTGLVGLKWQSSVITQVEALLGYQSIKFKEATFSDDSALKWRANIHWSPLDSTKLIFGTERDFQEANRLSNSYRVVDNYNINVTTGFSDFLQSVINIGYQNEKIIFQDSQQKESYLLADIKLNYQRNEWLSVYLQYNYHDLDSNQPSLSYQRNGISLGFSVSIK